MPLYPNEAAKRVLINYRQLGAMLKDPIGVLTAKTSVDSYNRILDSLRECFVIDGAFSDAVSHLQRLHTHMEHLSYQMESDGKVLLATAHSFIELYLSPADKQKAIGFLPQN